ncbi:hypothetical protein HHI36_000568 [Cryptolaemus montrouzieri]|uniref:BTB domain-containing protein n=1 Tax=Cryptolaemus montrouzieri TaxID=559131 RepID=A0ABD2P637_9CUCU
MAMSNLYSKISTKPVKRSQQEKENAMSVTQTNTWVNAETLYNGPLSLCPPQVVSQRESMQVMQPASVPGSPFSSPCVSPISSLGTLDPNWQATKPTVRERNAAMFNNDLMADVKFVVGSPNSTQVIPAHKYVLATGSSVFYAMFYGGLAECKEEIEVPDVEPSAFLTLLKYLYCDEIHLEADTVLATLYVAKKYIVPHLARACVNYLETSLTAKNACLLLSQSRLFEEPELMQRCWEVIDAQVRLSHSLSCLNLAKSTESPHKQHFSLSVHQLKQLQ